MFVVFGGFEAWGLQEILKNEVEFRCGLEASVFQKKGAKREPPGKRGRGRAAGAAEDHISFQHSLETIALQPFFFKRAVLLLLLLPLRLFFLLVCFPVLLLSRFTGCRLCRRAPETR